MNPRKSIILHRTWTAQRVLYMHQHQAAHSIPLQSANNASINIIQGTTLLMTAITNWCFTCTIIWRFALRLTIRRSFIHSRAHSLERVPKNSTRDWKVTCWRISKIENFHMNNILSIFAVKPGARWHVYSQWHVWYPATPYNAAQTISFFIVKKN